MALRIWKSIPLDRSLLRLISYGDWDLWLRSLESEFHYSFVLRTEPAHVFLNDASPSTIPPTDAIWERVIRSHKEPLSLRPVLPDRPLLIKTPVEIKLSPASQYVLAMRIPLGMALYQESTIIAEKQSALLRPGYLNEGGLNEFGYVHQDDLPITTSLAGWSDHHVMCPIECKNESSSYTSFSRIKIDLSRATIYEDGEGRLHLPRIVMTHTDAEGKTKMEQLDALTSQDGARAITEPRESQSSSVLGRRLLDLAPRWMVN